MESLVDVAQKILENVAGVVHTVIDFLQSFSGV